MNMNLKEAFRYQNKLQSFMDEAQGMYASYFGMSGEETGSMTFNVDGTFSITPTGRTGTFTYENVIAGQGTIGLEILDQLPDVEAVVVPVGGGGLFYFMDDILDILDL